MTYPVSNWKKLRRGYGFGVKTFYSAFHLGIDIIIPEGTAIYAWGNLEIIKAFSGTDGGNQIHVKLNGDVRLIRIMHLKALPKIGKYNKGEVIAYSGNTGKYTTAPHTHFDVSTNGVLDLTNTSNFEDPEAYFNKLAEETMELKKDSAGNQYLVCQGDKIAFSIPDEEQLAEVKAYKQFGEPVLFDPTGWLIVRGGSENWWKSKLNIK